MGKQCFNPLEQSTNGLIKEEPITLNFSNENNLKSLSLEILTKGTIILGFIGLVYGACRLAEYYGIIEKIR